MNSWLSIFRRLGPGLITVCVVIGPGSIVSSSKVGAQFGYQLLWVLVVAVLLMMVYMTLGARLGVLAKAAPGDLIRQRFGGWLTAVVGISVFVIAATFQFANNLGVLAAVDGWSSEWTPLPIAKILVLLVINGLCIVFLLGSKKFYAPLERLMTFFVGLMLIAFVINVCFARPAPTEVIRGFIPSSDSMFGESADWLTMIAWIGTTFSVAIAYFQAYLVRQKGWTEGDLKSGILDARVASCLLGFLTLMITVAAATALQGKALDQGPAEIAAQLEPAFGVWGRRLFCIGLFCAATSSFLVNSTIGGFLLADGLKLGSSPEDVWPRRLAVVVLIIGMLVAVYMTLTGGKIVPAIVFAQAVTVVVAPLIGILMVVLTNSKQVMGEKTNGPVLNALASIGLAMLIVLSIYTLTQKVIPQVSKLLDPPPNSTDEA